MICHYWYLKDIGHKFEPHVCNKCHDISVMVYELKNITILNVKGVDCRCVLWNMTKNNAINMLNYSKLDDKGTLWIRILMQIKRLLKQLNREHSEWIILETFILVLILCGRWYEKSWKEFNELKNIDRNYYCSNYHDVSVNKCGKSSRFWDNNGWINSIDTYGWFQWYFRYWLGRRSLEDERQINRQKGIVSLIADWLKWSGVLMVDLIIILFH